MTFKSAILVVNDVIKSRNLYEGILQCEVIDDFGEYNVGYRGGLALYQKAMFIELTGKDDIVTKANNCSVYFEFADIDSIEKKIQKENFEFVHPIREQPWGQRVFRFYDYDGHMMEIAEEMSSVFQRFVNMGMTAAEIAQKTGYTEERTIQEIQALKKI